VGDSLKSLEILRQITLCSREGYLRERVVILIENADVILPEGQLSGLSERDRYRVSKVQEWFSEPSFSKGADTVILMTEALSLLNHRVTRLPQTLAVEVGSPELEERRRFIEWFNGTLPDDGKLKRGMSQAEIAGLSAGLSLYALQQLLKGAAYAERSLTASDVIAKVEEFIIDEIGDDVIEFKKPEHTLRDVVGFERLKKYLKAQFIPRIRSSGPEALTGAAVAGPIGSGKSFIFEAVAGELGIVVLTIKNIRSKWYGGTDVLFEKLRRVLGAVGRALIFVDEADTQFGGVGAEDHSTERRLTGKIQALMSDPAMRGKVTWLLITARIHLLSPDIRRPGRAGSLIIPVLDPEGEDAREFLRWVLKGAGVGGLNEEEFAELAEITRGYSAAMYANLRSELKSLSATRDAGEKLTKERIVEIIEDMIPPAIQETRRYQTLQALVNTTRKSLLPKPEEYSEELRRDWAREIEVMERAGVR
jgi:SpoVK/Ycf46/Vps4 family AAA+-type ATPase